MDQTSAFRIVALRGRVATGRLAVLAGGLLARTGLLHAYAVWPSVAAPMLIVGASDSAAAEWMNLTFGLRPKHRLAVDAATWNVLRARALLVGRGAPHVLPAIERALGRLPRDPRIAFYGAGGAHPKLHCFVFAEDGTEPLAVVKVMAMRGESAHLEREADNVELIRTRLRDSGELLEALPVQPLWAGMVAGDFVVVEPIDPLAAYTGHADRETTLHWLRGFAAGTAAGDHFWSEADEDELVRMTGDAWRRARPEQVEPVLRQLRDLGSRLRGSGAPRCAVHGDFWRGNVAGNRDAMRVYDWEWLQLEGWPFFDIWTFELGELRQDAILGASDFADPLAGALGRVRRELERRGIDPGFGLPTLPPTLGRLTYRVRTEMGGPHAAELDSGRILAAAEELLLAGGS